MFMRHFRQALGRLSAITSRVRTAVDLQDAFVFGGLACAVYGVHQIYPPAAWILAGVTLFSLGIRGG